MTTQIRPSSTCQSCGTPLWKNSTVPVCGRCLLANAISQIGPEPIEPSHPRPLSQTAVQELFPELEIIALIGTGGMGCVFKARQPDLNRFVALKVLNPPFLSTSQSQSQFVARFKREARTLAKLNHPNIVTIFDFGERGGLYFLIMEFVAGGDLGRLMKSSKIDIPMAFDLINQIGDAIHYAHSQGVTHRDLKPANILIDAKGEVRLADFGIAKILPSDAETILTDDGVAVGTPLYMAPEQAIKPEVVDSRSDLYSLGVICYELLTGRLPQGNFPRPSECIPGLGKVTDEALLKSMAHDPSARFGTVREMLAAFEPAFSVTTDSPQEETPASKPKGRQSKPPQLVILSALGICGMLSLGWFGLKDPLQAAMTPRSVQALKVTDKTIPEFRPTSKVLSEQDLDKIRERFVGKTWRQQYGFLWVRFEAEGQATFWNVDAPTTQPAKWTLLPDGGVFWRPKDKPGIGRVFDFPESTRGTCYLVQHFSGQPPYTRAEPSPALCQILLTVPDPGFGLPVARPNPISISSSEREVIKKRFAEKTWAPAVPKPWKVTLHMDGIATHTARDGTKSKGIWEILPDGCIHFYTSVYNQQILEFSSATKGTALPVYKDEESHTFLAPPDVNPLELVLTLP